MIKSYPSLFIYINVICLSIIIILSRDNWFFTWIGFELSLFGFLPLFSTNSSTTESIIKYFLIQARGSAMFLISFLANSLNIRTMLRMLGLAIKLGLFPFFQWIPIVIINLSWLGCSILTTIQKIAPIIVFSSLPNNKILFIVTLIRIIIRALLGFNQRLIRVLIAYSSISHTSLILITFVYNTIIGFMYLIIYTTLVVVLFTSFQKNRIEKVNDFSIRNKDDYKQRIIILNLAGIPPFSIFIFKIFLFFMLIDYPFIVIIIILRTYVSTYYYLSFIIPKIIINKHKKTRKKITLILMLRFAPLMVIILLTKIKFDC